jgi:hypothetical protein
MKSLYIDNFKIHDIADPTCPYFLHTDIQGLEFPTMRVASMNKAGTDGILISDVLLGERRFHLPGAALGLSDLATFMSVRKQFLALQAPVKDVNGKLVKRNIHFVDDDGMSYRVMSQIIGVTFPKKYMMNAEFTIDCLADSLLIENSSATTVTGGNMVVGGFKLPVQVPIHFSGGFNGNTTATNNGTYEIWPIITLNGPLTNPQIWNKTTNILMAFSITLGVSDQLIIDMNLKTVMLNGQTNKIGTKSTNSRFFSLQPGNTTLNLSSSVLGEAGTFTAFFYDGYIGV